MSKTLKGYMYYNMDDLASAIFPDDDTAQNWFIDYLADLTSEGESGLVDLNSESILDDIDGDLDPIYGGYLEDYQIAYLSEVLEYMFENFSEGDAENPWFSQSVYYYE